MDRDSCRVEGTVEAVDIDAAAQALQKKGTLLSLTPNGNGVSRALDRLREMGATVTTRELMFFTRQIATLIHGGVPIVRALGTLEHTESPVMRQKAGEILRSVTAGKSLYEALREHPGVFSPVYLGLVQAGEASGQLVPMLRQLAQNLNRRNKLEARLRAAVSYPVLLLVVALGVLVIFSLKVVPTFAAVFKNFNMKLPFMTTAILDLSSFMVEWSYVLAALSIAAFVSAKIFLSTRLGKLRSAQAMLNLPVFKGIFENASLEQLLSVLGLVLSAGIPMLQALRLLAQTFADNPVYVDALLTASQQVAKGEPLSKALATKRVFPRMLIDIVATGEESGQLKESVATLTEFYSERTEMALENLTVVLEPILMMFVGGVIGLILLSLFMPMFQLTSLKPQ